MLKKREMRERRWYIRRQIRERKRKREGGDVRKGEK
jgi:hypothetical protein